MRVWRWAATVSAAWAQGPSFDCAKAATVVEKAICADAPDGLLAMLDERLAEQFRTLSEGTGTVVFAKAVEDQRVWLADRDACAQSAGTAEGALETCLAEQYRRRIQALGKQIEAARQRPALTGVYDYEIEGTLRVEATTDDLWHVSIETVHPTAFHLCTLDFDAVGIDDNTLIWTTPVSEGLGGVCGVRILFDDATALVEGNAACHEFCGMRGIFSGTYLRRD